MTLLVFQTIAFLLALYSTLTLLCTTWVFSAWVKNPNCETWKYNVTFMVLMTAISWGLFYLLVHL
jgi:hypothetical protein